jgi:hypothetical protein
MNSVKAAGYEFLIRKYKLKTIPHWHSSLIYTSGTTKTVVKQNGSVKTTFPSSYWPGDSFGDHLEFALKYDGTNLGILSALFSAVSAHEIAMWVKSKPTGKYARRIWFLFEFITGLRVPLDDLTQGNYVELLEHWECFTADSGVREKRQRIVNNMLGNREFCPVVRRTEALSSINGADIFDKCSELLNSYPAATIKRALSYLYSKETKSSFEIEHLKPSASRTERFIASLEMATRQDFCNKDDLISLQNRIVDERFRDSDYRANQNYIGEMISFRDQRIHYVCPKPGDVHSLMEGLIGTHMNMLENASSLPAIVHAAVVAFGFVYLHPFEDGNGRIHRFLIHNVLFLKEAVPDGLMFPVSAAMLRNPELYDSALESFSKPLLTLLKYDLDDLGEMEVRGETGNFYRYIDMTVQAEALFEFVKMTVDTELARELDFLVDYDKARKAIQKIVDMPDQKIDLLLNLCMQNNGRLSVGKRKDHFAFLTGDEVKAIEAIMKLDLSDKRSSVER